MELHSSTHYAFLIEDPTPVTTTSLIMLDTLVRVLFYEDDVHEQETEEGNTQSGKRRAELQMDNASTLREGK
jgi:hypothetical protein